MKLLAPRNERKCPGGRRFIAPGKEAGTSMLVTRREQMVALQLPEQLAFENNMLAHLRRCFPVDHALLGNAGLLEVIRAGQREAVALGFVTRGAPTGQHMCVLGFPHLHIAGGRIVDEWVVYDEMAMLTQIRLGELGPAT
jgi:hypothetical protein